jgi:hypothetical protein
MKKNAEQHAMLNAAGVSSVGLDERAQGGALRLSAPSDLAPHPSVLRRLSLVGLARHAACTVGSDLPSVCALAPRSRRLRAITTLPTTRRFPVTIDFSRRDVRLPFGVPRFVNAATLRVMAGGRRSDQLLKKVGGAWQFVDDATMIDLDNATVQFRLGRLTIYS